MKTVALTQEHKFKIYEMCKVLFPEYEQIDFYSVRPLTEHILGYLKTNKSPVNDFCAHWFEFCTTHLLNRIWERAEKYPKDHIYSGLAIKKYSFSLKTDLLKGCFDKKIHLVDYLYKQFKSLNAENL